MGILTIIYLLNIDKSLGTLKTITYRNRNFIKPFKIFFTEKKFGGDR